MLQEKRARRVGGTDEIALDVRVLAATNHDLEADIDAGTFRRDLYHRLNVFAVTLPPLRERAGDVPLLVDHFLGLPAGPEARMEPDALQALESYAFPGNVRELEHLLVRARFLADGGRITAADLPDTVRDAGGDLYDRLRAGGSFWELVRDPFLRRDLSKDDVRALIRRAYEDADRSYKGVAALFGMEREHKRLLDFLHRHDLGVR